MGKGPSETMHPGPSLAVFQGSSTKHMTVPWPERRIHKAGTGGIQKLNIVGQ
jgi:hypothetical protein